MNVGMIISFIIYNINNVGSQVHLELLVQRILRADWPKPGVSRRDCYTTVSPKIADLFVCLYQSYQNSMDIYIKHWVSTFPSSTNSAEGNNIHTPADQNTLHNFQARRKHRIYLPQT